MHIYLVASVNINSANPELKRPLPGSKLSGKIIFNVFEIKRRKRGHHGVWSLFYIIFLLVEQIKKLKFGEFSFESHMKEYDSTANIC